MPQHGHRNQLVVVLPLVAASTSPGTGRTFSLLSKRRDVFVSGALWPLMLHAPVLAPLIVQSGHVRDATPAPATPASGVGCAFRLAAHDQLTHDRPFIFSTRGSRR